MPKRIRIEVQEDEGVTTRARTFCAEAGTKRLRGKTWVCFVLFLAWISPRMECAEDYLQELLKAQARGECTAYHGRIILPIEALIAGLSTQPCRCRKHRQIAAALTMHTAPVPFTAERRPNLIWGEDAPLLLSEAALQSGMPQGTFRQKIYAREIASVLVGRQRMVQPSAVRAFFEQHKRPAL